MREFAYHSKIKFWENDVSACTIDKKPPIQISKEKNIF